MVCEVPLCPATPCREASRSPRGPWIIQHSAHGGRRGRFRAHDHLHTSSRVHPPIPLHLLLPLSVNHMYSRPHRVISQRVHRLPLCFSVWRQGTGERLNGLVLAWRQHAGIYLCFAFFPRSILHTSLLFSLSLCFRPGPQTSARPHTHTHTKLSQHPLECPAVSAALLQTQSNRWPFTPATQGCHPACRCVCKTDLYSICIMNCICEYLSKKQVVWHGKGKSRIKANTDLNLKSFHSPMQVLLWQKRER